MSARRIVTALAASLVLAAGGVLPVPPSGAAPTPPTARAACSGDSGVTVVVDFNGLDGRQATVGCAPGGAGEVAADVFPAAGYPLTYVDDDRSAGFVCRVSGEPAAGSCAQIPPGTAYWSLWWSDGQSGEWAYSSDGVNGLRVPDGGYLAFAWHQGSGNASAPDVAPTAHGSEPSDENGGGSGDGKGDRDGPADDTPGTTTAAPSATTTDPSASESESAKRKRDRDRDPDGRGMSDDPSRDETSAVPAASDVSAGPPADGSADPADPGDGQTFPTWIAFVLAGLVLGAAALVPLLRRRGA